MRYVLDSNIIIFYIRDTETRAFIESSYAPFAADNTAIISIVTVAEVMATAKKNDWGEKKLKVIQKLLDSLVIVEIRYADLIDAYVEIDTYSQGKLKDRPLKVSARNMGKNDLWIAATAYVTGSRLITADKDFEHLHGDFFEVIHIESKNVES
jgi:tRNA(fMet)-specific endonuclease VapC